VESCCRVRSPAAALSPSELTRCSSSRDGALALLLPIFADAISPLLLPSAIAGVRIAATIGPPLLPELLSLLPGVVGNKVGYAEEGAKVGGEGEEGNGRGGVGRADPGASSPAPPPLPLLLLELLPLLPGVVEFAVVVAASSVVAPVL
jgi:hypothetical protein